MHTEEIKGFVPVENDDGTEFMLPIVVGIRFTLSDQTRYGNEVGEPTTFTYSFRNKQITHRPATVAVTDKFGRPKYAFAGSGVVWDKVREQSFSVEQFIDAFSFKFIEPILNTIANAEEFREGMKEFREIQRNVNAKKRDKRKEENTAALNALQQLMGAL